jgi:hypothetical protein
MPSLQINRCVLRARLGDAPGAQRIDVDCVLDMTGMESVVGVEVLDLRRQLNGATVMPAPATAAFHWSYDPEIDAFYLRVQQDSARIQRKAKGVAIVDEHDRLVAIEVPLSDGP